MLVLMVTQGQYYVTDERTGSRHALTTARLDTFCKGVTGNALTPPWSRQPLQDYNAKGRAAMVAMLNSDNFREMFKRDMVRVESWAASHMGGQRQVEPQRHVGAREPRLEAGRADHGAHPLPRSVERRAQAHELLW